MIRKHKRFSRPKKPFDTERIKSENVLVTKYGLKNKREIWRAKAKLDIIRRQAKKLIHESEEEQRAFLEKLEKLGFKLENTVDVLALTEEDILKRRLQSVVFQKNIATTSKGARQLITHKHIAIDGKIVNIPSHMVSKAEESMIKLTIMPKKPKAKEPVAEVKEEASNVNTDNAVKSTSESEEGKKVDVTVSKEETKVEEKPKEQVVEVAA